VDASAICFDATGTLIETAEPVGVVYRRVALEYGVNLPAWRIEDAFRRILARAPARGTDGEDFETRSANEFEWWSERIRETFQATDSTARFDDFPAFAAALFETYRSSSAWLRRPGAAAMLEQLRNQGHSLAIVSNFDHRLPEILKGLEIASLFDLILIPATVGRTKPDRVLFEAAADFFSLPLDALSYVGDDAQETLESIEALGVHVVDMEQIEDLRELPDRLAKVATLPAR